ncbi:MAG: maltose alpha-D-glucosyltransferase [Deferrisomatales bacterium]|nr:maltose alpha-D-glucosyltransferase [Deferrisomatales bacterium]
MTDPLWYKDAVVYQLHVKAFCDSDADGTGDLRGLIEKLDYLEGLGVTALWLLPFYPSPLRDDGYDIADYSRVNPTYGTMRDFRELLRQAHRRGLRVITELVLNHTSDQHPWFQRARRTPPGSSHRKFYVWSDSAERYADARVIFQDFEPSNWSWDPVAGAYFWHRFYAHQPDLNFDHPPVHRALLRVMDYWLGMGVDGVRLDAVPYLYEREGTNCENLPETHAFLRKLRAHVDARHPGRMLLAEANQWPEDAAAYFGGGDECHMAFHFPVMPRLYMALQMEDRFPILDILEQTPAIPDSCQWAMFLRNHDELTLEMVTDEERDYMYRAYARDPRARINLGIRRRLAPLLRNSRRRIELMNILLFSLPGTPIVYYGDEIGMGDNHYLGDRDGVRTPMQWSPDRNAGFSRASPQQLYLPPILEPEYHFQTVNVENQERNPSSLLWWMRRVIAMRRRYRAFGRGTLEVVPSDNPRVLSFVRRWGEETVLVVANLSRFSQAVELDLGRWAGCTPVEVFSRNRFPPVGRGPYVLTLTNHAYYWFELAPERRAAEAEGGENLPRLETPGSWHQLLRGEGLENLQVSVLPPFLSRQRWFRSKARSLLAVHVAEAAELPGTEARLLFLQASYAEGAAEIYLLPLAFEPGRPRPGGEPPPGALLATVRCREGEGVLYDAVHAPSFRDWLLQAVAGRRRVPTPGGELAGLPGRDFARLAGARHPHLSSRVLRTEQTNTAVTYDHALFLKLYRAVEEGPSPDVEVARFLGEQAGLAHTPPFAGLLEYRRPGAHPAPLALLQGFVPNEGDAWSWALDRLGHTLERAERRGGPAPPPPEWHGPRGAGTSLAEEELLDGHFPELVELLGIRTAQMHRALASAAEDPAFRPEPFSTLYQRSVYQSMRSLVRRVFGLLEKKRGSLPEPVASLAEDVLGAEPRLLAQLAGITGRKLSGMKIRIHGDYHLGQALFTGKDFAVIDFEGEPARPPGERRLKRSALRDVAGMIRSFHYAGRAGLERYRGTRPGESSGLEPWVRWWQGYAAGRFLRSYLEEARGAPFLPADPGELGPLLRAFLLDKAVYELGYELNNRPAWAEIPLRGILETLEEAGTNHP